MGAYREMIPSYWICGGGSHINCISWDDVNGCLKGRIDVFKCVTYMDLESDRPPSGDY